MTRYVAPVQDMQFLLHDVFKVSHSDVPGYADLDPAMTEAILAEAGKLASEILAPLNAVGDREGCRLENGFRDSLWRSAELWANRKSHWQAASFKSCGRSRWRQSGSDFDRLPSSARIKRHCHRFLGWGRNPDQEVAARSRKY